MHSRQKSHGQRCGGEALCPHGNDEPEKEQKCRAPRAAQEGVRPEQGLFTVGQEFPMVLSPGYTGQVVRRRVLLS